MSCIFNVLVFFNKTILAYGTWMSLCFNCLSIFSKRKLETLYQDDLPACHSMWNHTVLFFFLLVTHLTMSTMFLMSMTPPFGLRKTGKCACVWKYATKSTSKLKNKISKKKKIYTKEVNTIVFFFIKNDKNDEIQSINYSF